MSGNVYFGKRVRVRDTDLEETHEEEELQYSEHREEDVDLHLEGFDGALDILPAHKRHGEEAIGGKSNDLRVH